MKFYLIALPSPGYADVYGPYESSQERGAKAHALVTRGGLSAGQLVNITAEVIGPLEASGYTDMGLL